MSTARLALLAALFATILWGATPPIAKYTFTEIPFPITAFLRFSLAALLFFPVLGLQDRLSKVHLRDYPILFSLAFLGITLSVGLFFIGLSMTSAIDAGIIISTGPVFNALAAKMILKEKISRLHWIGTFLASLGTLIIIVIQPLLETGSGYSSSLAGNLILLLAVLASTAFNILSKESFKKYDATTIIGFSFLFGSLTFLPFALWQNSATPGWVLQVSLNSIAGLVFLAVFASLIAYFIYEWSLEKLSIAKVLPMTFLQPIVTVLIAVPLLGEKISAPFVIGSILILIGMYLSTRHTPEHHRRTAHHRV